MKRFILALYQRRFSLVPSAVLLLVVGVHAVKVHADGLSPWKGGGFAMFSTVDSTSNRFVRAYLLKRGSAGTAAEYGSVSVKVPDEPRYREALLQAAAEPEPAHVTELARRVAAGDWYLVSLDAMLSAAAARLDEEREDGTSASDDGARAARAAIAQSGVTPYQVVGLEPAKAKLHDLERFEIDGARIEVFKLRWDWTQGSLRAEPLVEQTFRSR